MMMAPRPRRSLLPFALLLLLLCQGFLPTWAYVSVSAPLRSSKTTTTTSIIPPVSRGPLCRGSTVAPLHVALSLDQAEGTKKFLIDEESTRSVLAKAREMAFSEATSAADARLFLNRILEVQSACVSGVLASRDVCDDNIAEVAEVVAHLRRRIEQQAGNGNDSSSLLVHRYVVSLGRDLSCRKISNADCPLLSHNS